LLFKEKSKRISTSIGARAVVFRRRPVLKQKNTHQNSCLSVFAPLLDQENHAKAD